MSLPPIQFEWTISVGNLIVVAGALALARPAFKMYKTFILFMGEHEVLIDVACQMLNISRSDFAQKAVMKLAEKRAMALEARRASAGKG